MVIRTHNLSILIRTLGRPVLIGGNLPSGSSTRSQRSQANEALEGGPYKCHLMLGSGATKHEPSTTAGAGASATALASCISSFVKATAHR